MAALRQLFFRHERALYLIWAAFCTLASARQFYGYMMMQTGGEWSAPLDDVFIHFDYARATALVPKRADLVRMGRGPDGTCPLAKRAVAFVVRPGAQTRSARMLATLAWAEGGRAWEFAELGDAMAWLKTARNGFAFAPVNSSVASSAGYARRAS